MFKDYEEEEVDEKSMESGYWVTDTVYKAMLPLI